MRSRAEDVSDTISLQMRVLYEVHVIALVDLATSVTIGTYEGKPGDRCDESRRRTEDTRKQKTFSRYHRDATMGEQLRSGRRARLVGILSPPCASPRSALRGVWGQEPESSRWCRGTQTEVPSREHPHRCER